MKTPAFILKETFGYDTFRPLQQEVIENVLARRDTLAVMPTGGGKSLCYQIPSLLFDGLTVVVSPLISLMKDQVEQLRAFGVPSLFLNSSLSPQEYQQNMDYYYIDNLLKYAPLHDIGKVGIPDNILLKPGKLSESEFEIMKNHTKIGARILSYFQNNLRKYDINVFKMAVQIAVAHHEKWNGKGYPNGIAGKKIPLAARIVAVADVFDALSSKRIYKNAFPFDESVRMVNELSGESFDPDVVEAFNEGLEEIREIYDRMKEV